MKWQLLVGLVRWLRIVLKTADVIVRYGRIRSAVSVWYLG